MTKKHEADSGGPAMTLPHLSYYGAALNSCPPPGRGAGFHNAAWGVARAGNEAGIPPDQVINDLRAIASGGDRQVPDSEITGTVERAYRLPAGNKKRRIPAAIPGRLTCQRIIEAGQRFTESDIRAASPIPIADHPAEQATQVVATLYGADEHLFIGRQYDAGEESIKTAGNWLTERPHRFPHIIPNPLTGGRRPCKTDPGKLTFRGDACVAVFRYAVVEFDQMPMEDQIRFWAGARLPVAMLTTSGGKSVHGWLLVNVPDAETWDTQVRPMYASRLVPMGVDGACANPSRLSRLPGHYRKDKGNLQRLLFLDPEARGPRYYLTGGAQ